MIGWRSRVNKRPARGPRRCAARALCPAGRNRNLPERLRL